MLRRPCRYGSECFFKDTCRFAHPPPPFQRPPSPPPPPRRHHHSQQPPPHPRRYYADDNNHYYGRDPSAHEARRRHAEEGYRRASLDRRHDDDDSRRRPPPSFVVVGDRELSSRRVGTCHNFDDDHDRINNRANDENDNNRRRDIRATAEAKGSCKSVEGADHQREKSPPRQPKDVDSSDASTIATSSSPTGDQPPACRKPFDPPGEHASSLPFLLSSSSSSLSREKTAPSAKKLMEPDEVINSSPITKQRKQQQAPPTPVHRSHDKPSLPPERPPISSSTETKVPLQKLQQPQQTRTTAITLEDAYRYVPLVWSHLPSGFEFWAQFDEETQRRVLGPTPIRKYCHVFQLTNGQCRFGDNCMHFPSHRFCNDPWFNEGVQCVRGMIHELKRKEEERDGRRPTSSSCSIDSSEGASKRTTKEDSRSARDLAKQQDQGRCQQEKIPPRKRGFELISKSTTNANDNDNATTTTTTTKDDDADIAALPDMVATSSKAKCIKLEHVKEEQHVKEEDAAATVTSRLTIKIKEEP